MRIAKIGKRQYAFGLDWSDSVGDDPKEAVRLAIGEDESALYCVSKRKDSEPVVGYQKLTEPVKGRVYSYAQAIASKGVDGIYVGPTGENEAWYVVINNGQVVPSTDRLMEPRDILDAIDVLRDTFQVPLFLATGIDGSRFGEHETFDSEEIVKKVRVRPMQVIGSGSQLAGVLVLATVVVGISAAGWYLFIRDPGPEVDPVVQAQMLKQTYLDSVRAQVASIPASNSWLISAYRAATDSFPGRVSGWELEGVRCTPAACTATYALDADALGFGITPVFERFDGASVQILPDNKSFTTSVQLDSTEQATWSDEEILAPRQTGVRLLDVVGLYGMTFGESRVEADPSVQELHSLSPMPPEAAMAFKEAFATRADAYLDAVKLKGQAVFMDRSGFIATELNFSHGNGSIPAAWRIGWARVHGGEA